MQSQRWKKTQVEIFLRKRASTDISKRRCSEETYPSPGCPGRWDVIRTPDKQWDEAGAQSTSSSLFVSFSCPPTLSFSFCPHPSTIFHSLSFSPLHPLCFSNNIKTRGVQLRSASLKFKKTKMSWGFFFLFAGNKLAHSRLVPASSPFNLVISYTLRLVFPH